MWACREGPCASSELYTTPAGPEATDPNDLGKRNQSPRAPPPLLVSPPGAALSSVGLDTAVRVVELRSLAKRMCTLSSFILYIWIPGYS